MSKMAEILERWRAIDAELGSFYGLYIEDFAKRWRVSTKTIRRDLDAFRKIGQDVVWERNEENQYVWCYEAEQEWLFVSNLPRPLRGRSGGTP